MIGTGLGLRAGQAITSALFNDASGASSGSSSDEGDAEINNTRSRIERNQPKYRQDGTTFQNREGRLPSQRDPNYYKEWTVDTPGAAGRGARRIVTGQQGEMYYTTDHYRTFTRLPQ